MVVSVRKGMEKPREQLLKELVAIQYERNDVQFVRNKFRVRGDVVEIFPSSSNHTAIRVEYFGDEIDRICEVDTVTGNVTATLQHAAIFFRHRIMLSAASTSSRRFLKLKQSYKNGWHILKRITA